MPLWEESHLLSKPLNLPSCWWLNVTLQCLHSQVETRIPWNSKKYINIIFWERSITPAWGCAARVIHTIRKNVYSGTSIIRTTIQSISVEPPTLRDQGYCPLYRGCPLLRSQNAFLFVHWKERLSLSRRGGSTVLHNQDTNPGPKQVSVNRSIIRTPVSRTLPGVVLG